MKEKIEDVEIELVTDVEIRMKCVECATKLLSVKGPFGQIPQNIAADTNLIADKLFCYVKERKR